MKGNLILGTGRGKLGDIVLARRNGKQIARTHIAQISNPKSVGQQYQRMVFATASAAAKALGGIIDHSWEGVKYGQDSRARFMQENLKLLRQRMQRRHADGWRTGVSNFNIKGSGVLAASILKVSDGSLVIPAYDLVTESTATLSGGAHFYDNEVTAAMLSATLADESAYKALLQKMFNAVPGDQVTLILVASDESVVATYGDAVNTKTYVQYARIVFNEWSADLAGKSLVTANAFNADFINSDRSLNADALRVNVPEDDSLVLCTAVSPLSIVGAAVILSRPNGSSWLRSQSYYIGVVGSAANGPDVVGSYGPNATIQFGSDYYLNNATGETAVTDTAVPYVPDTLSLVGFGASPSINAAISIASAGITSYVAIGQNQNYFAFKLNKSANSAEFSLNGGPAPVSLDDESGLWVTDQMGGLLQGDNTAVITALGETISFHFISGS